MPTEGQAQLRVTQPRIGVPVAEEEEQEEGCDQGCLEGLAQDEPEQQEDDGRQTHSGYQRSPCVGKRHPTDVECQHRYSRVEGKKERMQDGSEPQAGLIASIAKRARLVRGRSIVPEAHPPPGAKVFGPAGRLV